MSLQIRKLYLTGHTKAEIRDILSIPKNTWDTWYYRNTQAFRVNFTEWRREKMMNQAEENFEETLFSPTEIQHIEDDEDGKRAVVVTDPKLLKLKLDVSMYIADTLGKEIYSKKLITEDPNSASKSEVEELRQSYKSLISKLKPQKGIDKLKNALK